MPFRKTVLHIENKSAMLSDCVEKEALEAVHSLPRSVEASSIDGGRTEECNAV